MTNPERLWDENGPGIVQTDYTNCDHKVKWKYGFTTLGQRIWICAFCRTTFREDRRRLDPIDEIHLTARAYKAGKTMQEVIKLSELNHLVVYNLFMGYKRRWPQFSKGEIYPPANCSGLLKNKRFTHGLKRIKI